MPTDSRTRPSVRRHRGGVPDEALHAAKRLGEREEADALHHPARALERAGFDRHHPAEARHLPLRQLVLRMGRQARIEDRPHPPVLRQPGGDAAAVLVVLAHPQRERLGPADRQPAVERTGDRPGRVLDVRDPLGEFVVLGDEHPTDHVGVPVQVLRRGVDDDVGAVLEGALEDRGREGVVHYEQEVVRPRDRAEGREVREPHHRVRRRLGVQQLGGRRDRRLDCRRVAGVHEREGEPHSRQDLVHQPVDAAVDVLAAHDVVACRQQLEERVHGRHPRGEGEAVGPALEGRHVALEDLPGRVGGPGVLVALVLADAVLDVGRRLVDREHHRAGEGVGLLAGVDGAGRQAVGPVVIVKACHRNLGGKGIGRTLPKRRAPQQGARVDTAQAAG
jgi:hypothetical protein